MSGAVVVLAGALLCSQELVIVSYMVRILPPASVFREIIGYAVSYQGLVYSESICVVREYTSTTESTFEMLCLQSRRGCSDRA